MIEMMYPEGLFQCVELEKAVLGCILNNGELFGPIHAVLNEECFYSKENRTIFKVMKRLFNKNVGIDILTVTNELRELSLFDNELTPYYISNLSSSIVFVSNYHYYSLIIFQAYLRRRLLEFSKNVEKKVSTDKDILEIINDIQNDLLSINNEIEKIALSFKSNNIETLNEIINPKFTTFLKTGINYLDELLGLGLNNTLVIGGKSGSGKTRFIISLVRELFLKFPDIISVLWYSMEDDRHKIIRCLLSPLVGLTDRQIAGKSYQLTEIDKKRLEKCKEIIKNWDMQIVDVVQNIKFINLHFNNFILQRSNRFNILIIDNIMSLEDQNMRQSQVMIDDYIARELKRIRTETYKKNIPTLTIVSHHYTDEQLEKSNIKNAYRPIEKHLKGSTRYRDNATQIILMNNPSNYPDLLEIFPEEKEILKRLLVLEVTKNRNDNIGIIRLFYRPEFSEAIEANYEIF